MKLEFDEHKTFHIERLKNQKLEKRITFDIYRLEQWIRVDAKGLGFLNIMKSGIRLNSLSSLYIRI